MAPMSGFDIRFLFTLPPRDSTLQYTAEKKIFSDQIRMEKLTVFLIRPTKTHTQTIGNPGYNIVWALKTT